MSKLPFIQLYTADYQRDTRPLSLAAKGAWVDILCVLHDSDTRGQKSMPVMSWARIIGATEAETRAVIEELKTMKVADVANEANGDVTLTNRRMMRDDVTREQTRLRVARHRIKTAAQDCNASSNAGSNAPCNAGVADKKTEDIKNNQNPLPPLRGEEEGAKKSAKPEPVKGPLQLRAERLMRRRPETPLTAGEARAFKKNREAIKATTEADWLALEAFYAAPQSETFARKDLATLINNWNGEIDRAKAWKPTWAPPKSAQPSAQLPEPANWRTYVADDMPTCPYAPGQPKHGCAWADVEPVHQKAIIDGMNQQQ